MNQTIPGLYVDENVIRIIAAQVILISVLTLISQSAGLAFFLAIDFALRAFTKLPAPLAIIGKSIAKTIGLTPKPIFSPPKRFAAALGFVFSVTISILLYFRFTYSANSIGGILIFCALLESVFKICLGCYIYNWVVLPILNKAQNNN